jgi:hypothetical protein
MPMKCLLIGLFISSVLPSVSAEKPLLNYELPPSCVEKVVLIGCSGEPMKCKSALVRFKSEKCLILEAQ